MHRRALLGALAIAPLLYTRVFAATNETSLSYDPQGRPIADVLLNGRGPFPLVIDTAAGGTVLNAAIIAQLALTSTGRARIQGASGLTDTELYNLASVEIGGLRREDIMAVQTPENSASAANHAGVLGAGVFAGARLEFDFAANMLRVDTAAERPPLDGAISITFQHRMFAHAPIDIAGVAATALIDTGARVSVANNRVREALGFAADDARLRPVEAIGGATAHMTETVAAEVRPTMLAGHDFGALDLNFAQLSVFRSMQLEDTPAVIVGIDLLRRAQALVLDYSSAQLQLRT